ANTTITDAKTSVREARRDARDRIREVVEHGHATSEEGATATASTRYVYNRLDQLTKVTDAAGNATVVEYDLAGRRTHILSPDSGLTELAYDPAGNVIER